jgi:hypothetical protein
MSKKKPVNYVDNQYFYQLLVERREQLRNLPEGSPKPQISNEIGEIIIKIANGLSYKHNFIGYSYRDEFILDGIEDCLKAVDLFKTEEYKNPFAYFTQVCYWSFVDRLKREKHQSKIRSKAIFMTDFHTIDLQEHDEDGDFQNNFVEFMKEHSSYDSSSEIPKDRKKREYKRTVLDDLMEEEL